jgi:four helix bundle protein
MSVMSNIAEGFERRSNKEFAHFLNLAVASASDVQSMLHTGLDVGYLSKDGFDTMLSLCRDTIRTTSRLQGYLRRSIRSQKPNRR